MKKSILLFVTVFILASFSPVQQTYVVKKGATVAVSEEGFDKMMDAVSNEDKEYFKKLIAQKYIVTLPSAIEVHLVDSSFLSGHAVYRLKGKDIKIWVLNEFVKKKE